MRKKIFQAMMAAAGSVLLASLIIILGCLYDYFDGLQEKQMQDELTLAAAAIEESGQAYLDDLNLESKTFRLTWIDAEGMCCMTRKQTAAAWKITQIVRNSNRRSRTASGELPLFFDADGKDAVPGAASGGRQCAAYFRSAGRRPACWCWACCSRFFWC